MQTMSGSGGVIGIDPAGEIVYSFNTPGMDRASIDTNDQLGVRIFPEH
ncbi:MAG: hypothetical protein EVA67_05470 [OM182 bacterium]|nr:MAG: hypothetical protein EVA67_05470 [OM182 bacterium]|tara:strand:+ start:2655 stop:2798 length:144 start_codon:yes stop_codon:yes gene_type:complete